MSSSLAAEEPGVLSPRREREEKGFKKTKPLWEGKHVQQPGKVKAELTERIPRRNVL